MVLIFFLFSYVEIRCSGKQTLRVCRSVLKALATQRRLAYAVVNELLEQELTVCFARGSKKS